MTSKTRAGSAGGDDELLDQWSFLDSMIDRQASSLRAGTQDPEEVDEAQVVPGATSPEFEELRTRVTTLEGERDALRQDLAKARKELKAAHTRRALATAAAANVAAVRAELETAHTDLENARRTHGALGDVRATLESERTLTASLRRQIESAPGTEDIRRLRDEVERERQLRERADANSADLMRALRNAHAEVEAAQIEAEAAHATLEGAVSHSPGASPPSSVPVPIHAHEHPPFDVFDPPNEPPMLTRYEHGPPALSSTDLVRTSREGETKRASFLDRLFGRRR